MTAYRQQALACAASLAECPRRTSELRSMVPNAPNILLRNVYGWFTQSSGAFTTSLLKAPPRSPDGQQRRSPKKQGRISESEIQKS